MDAPPVQYVKTSDGYDIAYTVCGEGHPLILFHPVLTNVELIWRHYPDWMEGLAQRFKLICFDPRYEGLSSRGLGEGTVMADFVLDVDALADRFEGESFLLYAVGLPGHDAVRFAAANPDRVDAIVLNAMSVSGAATSSGLWQTLPRENWQLFLTSVAPRNLDRDELRRRLREYEACVTREDWTIGVALYRSSNIEAELQQLQAPVLVMHPRSYPILAVEESMAVTATAPNARFVVIDSGYAWGDAISGLAAIDTFLKDVLGGPNVIATASDAGLSARELEVLRLLAVGKSNQQIADELVISLRTSRKHVSNILSKTGTANRTEAAAYARDHGHL